MLLTPLVQGKKPTLSTPNTLVVSTLYTEHLKENVIDAIAHAARECRTSKNHTYEKCGKIGSICLVLYQTM